MNEKLQNPTNRNSGVYLHNRRASGESLGCNLRAIHGYAAIGDCVMKTGDNMSKEQTKNACINQAVRDLWLLLKKQGLQAKTIKFDVVDGELRQVDIFGEIKIEMV